MKDPGHECAIKTEALQNGGNGMVDFVHGLSAEGYTSATPHNQWSSVIVPLS